MPFKRIRGGKDLCRQNDCFANDPLQIGKWVELKLAKQKRYTIARNCCGLLTVQFFGTFASFFPQFDCFGGHSPSFVFQFRIVLFGGVNVFMSEDVGDQINIAGFPVKIGAVGTAQLMR